MKDNRTKPTPIWLHKEITRLAEIYSKSPRRFNTQLKRKACEIAVLTSKKYVARKLNLHPTTLGKWDSLTRKSENNDRLDTHKQGETAILDPASRDSRPPARENGKFIPLTVFILVEIFLVQQSFLLAKDIFSYNIFNSVLFALIVEMIPISMYHLRSKEKGMTGRGIIGLCIIASFCISVFCAAGKDLNQLSSVIAKSKVQQEKIRLLKRQVSEYSRDIDYYKTAVRQDGKGRGWPHKVASLHKQKVEAEGSLRNLHIEVFNPFDYALILAALIMRIVFQLASIMLSRSIF